MDTFLEAYITAALWSSTDESTPEGGDFLDKKYGPDDLAPETLEKMKADCEKFQSDNANAIDGRDEQAGHDFWFTRNHHGCGFWDDDWPDAGDRLALACKGYPEVRLYVGEDGRIYA